MNKETFKKKLKYGKRYCNYCGEIDCSCHTYAANKDYIDSLKKEAETTPKQPYYRRFEKEKRQ